MMSLGSQTLPTSRRCAAAAVAALSLVAGRALAQPVSYAVTRVADTADGVFSGFGDVCLNGRGQVAFVGLVGDFATGASGVHSGRGGALTTLASGFPYAALNLGAHALNDGGDVVYSVNVLTDTTYDCAVVLVSDGASIPIAREASSGDCSAGGPCQVILSGASVDCGRRVVFSRDALAIAPEASQTRSILSGKGGDLRTIADSASPPFALMGTVPDSNDGLAVAFWAFDVGVFDDGIYLADRGTVRRLHGVRGPQSFPFLQPIEPALARCGAVAFVRVGDPGEFLGVARGNGSGEPTTIAELDAEHAGFGDRVALNDRGEVVYTTFDGSFAPRVEMGDGASTTRVLSAGDAVLGRVVSTWGAKLAINDRGQIALRLAFSDGSQAVVRLDPVHAP